MCPPSPPLMHCDICGGETFANKSGTNKSLNVSLCLRNIYFFLVKNIMIGESLPCRNSSEGDSRPMPTNPDPWRRRGHNYNVVKEEEGRGSIDL